MSECDISEMRLVMQDKGSFNKICLVWQDVFVFGSDDVLPGEIMFLEKRVKTRA